MAATKSTRKRKPADPKPAPKIDLYEMGARVLNVFGPFGSRTLVEIPTETAADLFPDPLFASSRTGVVEAVERDIAEISRLDQGLAESGLAATAVALAYEIENPYNSATSKSMCARALTDALAELRALAPAEEEKDGLDDLTKRRQARLAAGGATA
jgi:hypothetical protein